MKVVYYKFFVFCAILFLASQISIQIGNNAAIEPVIRVFGEILMALLVFDFFLIPNPDTHPDDIAIIHTSILWFLGFIFLLLCSMNHFMNVADENKGWNIILYLKYTKFQKKSILNVLCLHLILKIYLFVICFHMSKNNKMIGQLNK